jgi:hypothetical protein
MDFPKVLVSIYHGNFQQALRLPHYLSLQVQPRDTQNVNPGG